MTSQPHRIGQTHQVIAPEPDCGGKSEPHDLNWPIPRWTIVPVGVVMGAAVVAAFGASRLLLGLLPFCALLAAVTVIDLRELRVPNRLVGPAALLAVPLLLVASTADWPDLSFSRAMLGALAMGGAYFVLALIYPAGMGLGDVKLSPLIGAQLALFGWIPFWRGLLGAFLIVGPVAIILLVLQKAGRNTGMPFAPFMVAGAMLALVLEGVG